MPSNIHAPVVVTLPNNGVKDDQDGMDLLNWSWMSSAFLTA